MRSNRLDIFQESCHREALRCLGRQFFRLTAATLIQVDKIELALQRYTPRIEHVARKPRPAVQQQQVGIFGARPPHAKMKLGAVA